MALAQTRWSLTGRTGEGSALVGCGDRGNFSVPLGRPYFVTTPWFQRGLRVLHSFESFCILLGLRHKSPAA